MMNSLMTISNGAVSDTVQNTVNARELHAFLQSKQDFSTWIKTRIT